ncbi:hypothetical protein [Bradyrhizobium arachidis]|uniref:hypothetical protein n=1 Tax=Bradyrhizobium TaxID=374 RepID=UPI0038D14F46
MALHRDIFWVGRQWAVTGFGIQAVDQRLRGVLDIEVARLWDDDFVQSRRTKPGINVEDFDKALTMARTRHPQGAAPDAIASKSAPIPPAPRKAEAPPADESAEVGSLIAMLSKLEPTKIPEPPAAIPKMPPPAVRPPLELRLELRAEGRLARFLPQWRIRR